MCIHTRSRLFLRASLTYLRSRFIKLFRARVVSIFSAELGLATRYHNGTQRAPHRLRS